MTPDPDATPTTERAAPLAEDTPARRSDPNAPTTPRRTRRPYRHSRPVFDRPVRIHSEYARRLVSERQFRPAMTALYGLDVILRLIATEAEADQVETVIATRLSELSQELVRERERLHAELERYDLLAVRPRYTQPIEQKLALDKASRFTETFQQVVQSDPYLDETTRRPVGTYANLLNRVAGEQREAQLRALARDVGIWFFYRADCPYCTAQAPVLARLAHRLGLTVQAIALDGQPLPTGHFPDFRADAGQAARLGVVSTPALFLVRPPDGLAPLAQGLLSLSDLEQRLLLAAHTAGWIEAADYARTRPLVTDLRLAPAPEQVTEIPTDPETFLARLRHHTQGRDPTPVSPDITPPTAP